MRISLTISIVRDVEASACSVTAMYNITNGRTDIMSWMSGRREFVKKAIRLGYTQSKRRAKSSCHATPSVVPYAPLVKKEE